MSGEHQHRQRLRDAVASAGHGFSNGAACSSADISVVDRRQHGGLCDEPTARPTRTTTMMGTARGQHGSSRTRRRTASRSLR
jgi:hypothetical protein